MSNYTKATNFATKDTLETGNPSKIIKGTEIDTEFNAISSAVSSKADTASPTFTGTPAAPTATTGTDTSQIATTAFVQQEIEAAGGQVVQMVQSVYETSVSTTSTSYVTTGHSATITPTSASNKILVLHSAVIAQTNTYAVSANTILTLYRDGANIAPSGGFFAQTHVGYSNDVYTSAGFNYLDSPASTSAETYTIYMRVAGSNSPDGAYNAGVGGTSKATIILLEISE